MEWEGRYDISRSRMDYIRGFSVYVYNTYRYMNPYLNGVYLTVESWKPYRDAEGCRLRGEELKIQQWRLGKVGAEDDGTYRLPLT